MVNLLLQSGGPTNSAMGAGFVPYCTCGRGGRCARGTRGNGRLVLGLTRRLGGGGGGAQPNETHNSRETLQNHPRNALVILRYESYTEISFPKKIRSEPLCGPISNWFSLSKHALGHRSPFSSPPPPPIWGALKCPSSPGTSIFRWPLPDFGQHGCVTDSLTLWGMGAVQAHFLHLPPRSKRRKESDNKNLSGVRDPNENFFCHFLCRVIISFELAPRSFVK